MKRNLKRIVAGVLATLMLVASVWAVPTSVTVVEEAGISAGNDDIAAKLMDISGDGSEEDPFLIETEEDLMLVSDFPDCHFKLANDIALACEDWEPLCVLTDAFSGTFDGNGHTISNLTITSDNTENGLFSENAGVIKNLNVETSTTGVYLAKYTGILVANNSRTIENCNVSGNICRSSGGLSAVYCGGFVGYNTGSIENCTASGEINISTYVSDSSQSTYKIFVGGFGGYNTNNVTNSSSVVDVNVDKSYYSSRNYNYYYYDYRIIGGFLGCNGGNVALCFNQGKIKLGGMENDIINGYYYTGNALYNVGGFIGANIGAVEDCATVSTISKLDKYATIYSGGFAYYHSGISSRAGTITNCYAVTNGEVGYGLAYNNSVTNSFYDKGVSGLTDTSYGTPKTTAAMKMAATYTKAGWDFENTWAISKNINDGYPYLQWMYQKNEDYTPAFDDSMQAYLNLDELISMSVCYKFDNMAVVNAEAYLDSVGLLVWNADEVPEEATIDDCDNIIAGAYYNSVLDRFETTTNGIAPKKLGDGLAFRAYYVDEDGNYTYSRLITDYCPKTYCYNRINNSDSTETVELMASILNYGAAAQKYLGYKADDLMNKDLPDELKIMVVE